MLARYTENQGRPLRQRELCERHAGWLKANRPNVHNLRNAADAGQVKLNWTSLSSSNIPQYTISGY